jgi:tetratricopeptide (TPR) repeat protein
MTETLITELARLKGLRVISRQSTSIFKGVKQPLSEIARRLDVDLILEGSVLHAGDRVRIAAQLLRAEPEAHVWADAFDGSSKDVLGIQYEIACAIAREVGGLFGNRPAPPADHARAVDPRAYDEFLRGVVRFPYTTLATFDEVVGHFERAAALDAGFAEAHAWIAFAWMNAVYVGARSLKEARDRALPAVEHALAAAPHLGSIHAIHATALMAFARDWDSAASAWTRAEDLGGGDARSYAPYWLFLTSMGRFEEALARVHEGVRINPLGPPEQFALGWVHFRTQNYEKAVGQLTWTLSQWPEYPWTASFLAASQLFGGWPARAIETCRKALAFPNIPTSLALLAATLGRAGEVEQARQIVEQIEHINDTAYLDPCPLAVAYAGLGEDTLALSALERLLEEGSIQSWSLPIEVFFDPLRSHPRFRRIIDALRLPTVR